MSAVAAIGEQPQIIGFALAGALIYPADTAEQARAAWQALPRDVAVVILTGPAGDALAADRAAPQAPLTVVLSP
jgi:vacuolar-type H+-ATPase subunit F/Vma7